MVLGRCHRLWGEESEGPGERAAATIPYVSLTVPIGVGRFLVCG